MRKEAAGVNGVILGGSDYWSRVNRATFIGGLMRRTAKTTYHETLQETRT